MNVLVLSNRHHLLPFADQLSLHHTVTTVVLKDRYEPCWDNRLPKALKGKQKSVETYKRLFAEIKEAKGIVVTDSRKMTESALAQGCTTYGVLNSPPTTSMPNMFLLGWYDDEQPTHLCLAVPDWGLWPAGMGPFVLGSLTIGRWHSAHLHAALGGLIPIDVMKSDNFHGLFAVHLQFDGNGFARVGFSGGWPPCLSHGYLSLFSYEYMMPNFIIDKMHTVSLPVSIPPYPLDCNYRAQPARLDNELMGMPGIALHDVTGSPETAKDELWTAGTDGLVAVVSSSADRLTKARQGALELASRIRVPQVQWRADAGCFAEKMFDLLEDYGL